MVFIMWLLTRVSLYKKDNLCTMNNENFHISTVHAIQLDRNSPMR